MQDAVHEVVAHQRAGVARDVGRNAHNAQVAHDAAEGEGGKVRRRAALDDFRTLRGVSRLVANAVARRVVVVYRDALDGHHRASRVFAEHHDRVRLELVDERGASSMHLLNSHDTWRATIS